jgi:hypothetical protein
MGKIPNNVGETLTEALHNQPQVQQTPVFKDMGFLPFR